MPDSGAYSDTEAGTTYTERYTGMYEDCVAARLPFGTIGTGTTAGFVLKSCTVTKSRGEAGIITLTWGGYTLGGGEGEDPVLPADRFALTPMDLNPAIEKAPVFAGVSYEELEKIQTATQTADGTATLARNWIEDNGGEEANELLNARLRGQSNFYQPFFEYAWQQSFSSEPAVDTGGYRQAPGGPLETLIAGLSLSCLRKADQLVFENNFYVRTRTWLCAPSGTWSTYVYPAA